MLSELEQKSIFEKKIFSKNQRGDPWKISQKPKGGPLDFRENSNCHNSAHILLIWINDLPLYCMREGLSNDVVFVPGHGS